jgi:hypothetical protein
LVKKLAKININGTDLLLLILKMVTMVGMILAGIYGDDYLRDDNGTKN